MTAVIQAHIEPEDVVQAMIDDGVFASEMWTAITQSLNQGMLMDNTLDQINSDQFDRSELHAMQSALTVIADMCATRLET